MLKYCPATKEGAWSRRVTIDRPFLPTQSPMFFGTLKGLLLCFKFQKMVTAFRAYTRWSLFLCVVRYQKFRSTLWSHDTFIELANEGRKLRGELWLEGTVHVPILPLPTSYSCNDVGSIANCVSQGEEGNKKEYFRTSVVRFWGFATKIHIKKTSPFYGLKTGTGLLNFKSSD